MRGGHAVALSVIAAAAFGLVGLRAVDLPGPRPVSDSDRLRIEVVHPVEPDIAPGTVMEVGALEDGFQGLPLPLSPLTDVAWTGDDGWEGHDEAWAKPRSEPRRGEGVRTYESRPVPERPSPLRAVQRWFGFDEPRRDFRAERAARRARLEAIERDARERYAAERFRRERVEDDRYVHERGRDEVRDPPRWRDDRAPASEDDWRPSRYGPPEAPPGYASAPQPPGSRPYSDWSR